MSEAGDTGSFQPCGTFVHIPAPTRQDPPHLPPYPPSPDYQPAPIKGSNFLPIVLTTIFLLVCATIIYSRLPRDYQQCSRWPGSRINQTDPSTCRTFYGATFTSADGFDTGTDTDFGDIAGQTDQGYPPELPSPTPLPATDTTKAGLPLPTPTPKPQVNPPADDINITDWTTHRYPIQKITLKLPPNWTSTHVTRQLDTGIMTFAATGDGGTIDARIQPNWDNTGSARDQSITFMLTSDTGVIKVDGDNTDTYYFEYSGQVYIFSCTHRGNRTLQNTFNHVLRSIQLI